MSDPVSFDVKVSFSRKDIMGLLCCAFECGIGYWWNDYGFEYVEVSGGIPDGEYRLGVDLDDFWSTAYLTPTSRGGKLRITSATPVEDRSEWELSIETLCKGLQVMREKSPYQFSRFVNEDSDADTGDIFFQCCLFGEVVFG